MPTLSSFIEYSREVATVWVSSSGVSNTAPVGVPPAAPEPSIQMKVCRMIVLFNSIGEKQTLLFDYPNVGEVYSTVISNTVPNAIKDAADFRMT